MAVTRLSSKLVLTLNSYKNNNNSKNSKGDQPVSALQKVALAGRRGSSTVGKREKINRRRQRDGERSKHSGICEQRL